MAKDFADIEQGFQREWGQVFGDDDVLATAVIDRLFHRCGVLAVNGAGPG